MRALLLLPLLTGCAGLGAWMDEPASPGPIVIEDPDSGAAVILPEGDPIPGETPVTTKGDQVARAAGRWAGTLTGNPLLGLLIGGVATLAVQSRRAPTA